MQSYQNGSRNGHPVSTKFFLFMIRTIFSKGDNMCLKWLSGLSLGLVICAVAGILVLSVTAENNLPPPLSEFDSFAKAKWNSSKYARLSRTAGKIFLTVKVPNGAPDKAELNCAETQLDLTSFCGESLCFMVKARAKDVSTPEQNYNGVKFMLNYKARNGNEFWPGTADLKGSFDWQDIGFIATISESAGKGRLQLGLQDSSGTVEFDLSTLRVFRLFPRVNRNYKVKYPKKIADTPPLRGVMSPHSFTDDDLDTLHEWNVKLVRAQLTRDWGQSNTDRELSEYDQWLNSKLDHLEDVFRRAEKYGIKFVIDLHSPPGGRDDIHNMTMFYNKKYADHFVKVWERIAKRFKDNPSVWAYDLVNEPVQSRLAKYDYWNIQRLAAEAVRKIDPDTPIMIASNDWNSAPAYTQLSPLAMDNIIYQVHMYAPGQYTHQLIHNTFGEQGDRKNFIEYPGMIANEKWNKEMIRKHLQPVRDFQLRHNARIYVGEFSAIAWAPGAEKYLKDCIEIFEEYGWDWTYHAFREWEGWSVEHEATKPSDLKPAKEDTLRKKVLLEYFRRNR